MNLVESVRYILHRTESFETFHFGKDFLKYWSCLTPGHESSVRVPKISNIWRNAPRSESPWKIGWLLAISNSAQPRDQISTLPSYMWAPQPNLWRFVPKSNHFMSVYAITHGHFASHSKICNLYLTCGCINQQVMWFQVPWNHAASVVAFRASKHWRTQVDKRWPTIHHVVSSTPLHLFRSARTQHQPGNCLHPCAHAEVSQYLGVAESALYGFPLLPTRNFFHPSCERNWQPSCMPGADVMSRRAANL